MNITASLLVGGSLGDKNPNKAIQISKLVMVVMLIGACILSTILYSLKDVIPMIFTSIPSVKQEITSCFLLFVLN